MTSQYDSNTMINMMMGGYTMNMMNQLKESSFSYKTVLLFIALMMINDIKKYIQELIEYLKVNIPIWIKNIWLYLKELLSKLKFKKKVIVEHINEEYKEEILTKINVELETNIFTINSIHHFLNNKYNKNCTNNFGIKIESHDKQTIKINYPNIIFNINENIKAISREGIEVAFNTSDNNVESYKINENTITPVDKMQNFDDILMIKECKDEKIKKYLIEKVSSVSLSDINTSSAFKDLYTMYTSDEYPKNRKIHTYYRDVENAYLPQYFLLLLFENYTKEEVKKNVNKFLINYAALIALNAYLVNVLSTTRLDIFFKDTSTYSTYYTQITCKGEILYNLKLKKFPITTSLVEWSNTTKLATTLVNLDTFFKNSIKSEPSTSPSLLFQIISKEIINERDLYDMFFEYYKNNILKSTSKKADKKISVYSICINKKEEIQNEPNPDYDEWMELFNNLNSDDSKSNDSKGSNVSTASMTELLKIKPSKTVKKTIITSVIECKEINKFHKDLNTLYLREIDKIKLLNIVDKFKNKKNIYDQLGIPHKLGMMFYGAPGTGKTTSIKAIASYLEKNLYFVNLKNVKTNSDLKSIFEHINEKCNGGVIVFEDIDVMTDVVKKRSVNVDIGVTSVLEEANDNLTLSYLLNLLDGSLCKDGTIFAITTNYIENIDPALYRKGRVDITIDFKKCDHYQINKIYESIIGRSLNNNILKRIPENEYAPCDIIFHIYQYMLEDIDDEEIMKQFMENI